MAKKKALSLRDELIKADRIIKRLARKVKYYSDETPLFLRSFERQLALKNDETHRAKMKLQISEILRGLGWKK